MSVLNKVEVGACDEGTKVLRVSAFLRLSCVFPSLVAARTITLHNPSIVYSFIYSFDHLFHSSPHSLYRSLSALGPLL